MTGKIMDLFPLGLWERLGFNSHGQENDPPRELRVWL